MNSYDPRNRPMLRVNTLARPNLLAMVLGITAVGFVITALAAYLTRGLTPGTSMIAMLVGFGLLFGISATRENASLSLLLFYAFTACEGIGIGPVIQRYITLDGGTVVMNAAMTTGVGMALLGGVVYATSFDFRRIWGFANAALIALVILGVLSLFIHLIHPATYAWATLAIFSALVLVDFGRVRAGGDNLSPVQLAVQIYLDGINIFLALLRIFSGNRR